jgi:hypothetical protein
VTLKREGISLALFPLPFHPLLPRFLSFFTSCLRKREGKKEKSPCLPFPKTATPIQTKSISPSKLSLTLCLLLKKQTLLTDAAR